MPTTSLNDPIDGAELKQIILKRISDALDKDCTLVDDIAYAGFVLKFEINLTFKRSRTPGTLIWGTTTDGGLTATTTEDVITPIQAAGEYETDSPNTAREEHDLPVPVMIKTPSGETRRKIHINPPKPKPTT